MQPALENVFVCALAKTETCQAPVHNDDEDTDLFHSVLQTHILRTAWVRVQNGFAPLRADPFQLPIRVWNS